MHGMKSDTSGIRILVVDDEPLMGDFLKELFARRGYHAEVAGTGREAVHLLRSARYDVVLADARIRSGDGRSLLSVVKEMSPASRVVVMTAVATVESTIEAMRLGASDCLTKPLRTGQVEELIDRLLGASGPAEKFSSAKHARRHERLLIGESAPMQEIHALIDLAASTDATVLICGETGTGKELVARAIHTESARRTGRFVRLNCAALPETLYESELFGHERGAFTGALRQKKGRFELAHGGTLLMDEISEIGWAVQAKLLRVLQEKEFERVGGCATIRVDARIVATTNKDLAREIREERFRSDLYYRLSVFPITVAPLRERREDIPALAEFFLERHCRKNALGARRLTERAVDLLTSYRWPGNVRQLENCLERAALVSPGTVIDVDQLSDLAGAAETPNRPAPRPVARPAATIRQMEADLLLRTLEEEGGNRTRAAERLGITTRTLRNKLHRIGQMDFLKGKGKGKKVPPSREEQAPFPAGRVGTPNIRARANLLEERRLERVGAAGPEVANRSVQRSGG